MSNQNTDNVNSVKQGLLEMIASMHDTKGYQELNWEGGFADYLHIVEKNPKVVATAFQRIYDMILSYGYEEYSEYKKKIMHYKFFEDPMPMRSFSER